ncbi:phosphatidylinositol-specific phospholipase C1-like protein [Paucibacter sp. O1-1]|nr:phosphatidylinositol-specific phospholipase C1-like protein [Paucibacter sp. O1-1]MDA3826191.1 phosphatidylinositol-specific phospholipase C1-like protein [Paucibacter sp. O1-1]
MMTIRNNPKDTEIKDLSKKATSSAPAPTGQFARPGSMIQAVLRLPVNRAQIITTDYYLKSTHFKSDYSVSFDGKKHFRVNPLFMAAAPGKIAILSSSERLIFIRGKGAVA